MKLYEIRTAFLVYGRQQREAGRLGASNICPKCGLLSNNKLADLPSPYDLEAVAAHRAARRR